MVDDLELTPIEQDCIRCGHREPMRFAGLCTGCRDHLHARYTGERREIEVAAYEPKMNVTPNAVALRES